MQNEYRSIFSDPFDRTPWIVFLLFFVEHLPVIGTALALSRRDARRISSNALLRTNATIIGSTRISPRSQRRAFVRAELSG